jgi:hypothetical protein
VKVLMDTTETGSIIKVTGENLATGGVAEASSEEVEVAEAATIIKDINN